MVRDTCLDLSEGQNLTSIEAFFTSSFPRLREERVKWTQQALIREFEASLAIWMVFGQNASFAF